MTRPTLTPVPLANVLPPHPGTVIMTMSIGPWDTVLQVGYDLGFVLLELDDDERPGAASRKKGSAG